MTSFRTRPRVTLKLAQTLDGRIATATGHSRWISSAASRASAHALRASHDAVLVGIGTVLADDPHLTVRHVSGPNPTRVVIDSSLRIPTEAAVLAEDGTPVVVISQGDLYPAGISSGLQARAEILRAPAWEGQVDLEYALQELYRRGIRSVLVEGGAGIATNILRRRLLDELVLFIAPKIVGAGIDAIGDLQTLEMTDAVQFSASSIEQLDGDIVFRGTPRWPER